MAKKKLDPLEDPPTASSSDEEEVETLSGEEEEEEVISDDSSSEEEDELMNPVNIPSGKKPKPPSIAVPGRLSVVSGSESSPSKLGSKKAFVVAIAAVKPMEKEVRGSPARKKRPDEKSSTEVIAKRARKASEEAEKQIVEDTKKPLFQRLWSQEDEISLLQGMIDFEANKGYSPYEDMDGFYELAMKSISFEASKNQFMDKIRSLKKKYMGKMKKGVESSSKGHDYECFKLSKCIWGSDGIALKSAVKSNVKKSEKKMDSLKPYGKEVEEVESDGMALESPVKSSVKKKSEKKMDSLKPYGKEVEEVEPDGMALESSGTLKNGEKELDSLEANGEKVEEDREVLVDNGKKVEEDKEVLIHGRDSGSIGRIESNWFEDSVLVQSIASLGVDEQFVKQKWSTVAVDTKTRMEEKWKLLQTKEMEIVLQKIDFMREIGSVIAEAS